MKTDMMIKNAELKHRGYEVNESIHHISVSWDNAKQ